MFRTRLHHGRRYLFESWEVKVLLWTVGSCFQLFKTPGNYHSYSLRSSHLILKYLSLVGMALGFADVRAPQTTDSINLNCSNLLISKKSQHYLKYTRFSFISEDEIALGRDWLILVSSVFV